MSFTPAPLGPDARRRLERGFWGLSGLFTVIGVALPMAFAQADTINYLFNIVMYGIAFILEKLLDFFGGFILMLVNAIIGVSEYNTFTTATPVEAGWPLVRDVVNMFFIVVLLITAFSTIIQYKKFDYKKILPKLLLMAVLVNFSKTIIGLLIDFSQVVMLTFVNGYKAAAAGNFTQVLKLDKVLQWAQNTDPQTSSSQLNLPASQQTNDPMLVKIVLAEMLGMFMLGTSLVTLLIMLVYLIARIIGLWVALIMSPLAFFVGALPGEMTKGAGAITGDFWPRLTAMLTGGPIMAFFLWLTLATIQTGGFGDFNASQARNAEQAGSVIQYFSTSVGNSQELATFLVGIIMLLMGLDAAVSISKQAAPQLGKVYDGIKNRGMRYTRLASYGALASGGGLAARGVYRGARATAVGVGRLAENRLDITGKLGRTIQTIGSKTPFVGGAISGAGGKLTARRGKERARYEKEAEAGIASLPVGTAIQQLVTAAGRTANKDKQKAYLSKATKLQVTGDGMKAINEKYQEVGRARGLEGADLKAYAEEKTRVDTGKKLADLMELARETNDEPTKKFVNETWEKRTDLVLNKEALSNMIGGMMDDPEGGLKKVGSKAWEKTEFLNAWARRSGMLEAYKADGTFDEEHISVKKLLEGGGTRAELIRKFAGDVQEISKKDGITLEAALDSKSAQGMYVAVGRDAKTGKTTWHLTQQTVMDAADAAEPSAFDTHANAQYHDAEKFKARKEEIQQLRRSPATTPTQIRDAQYHAMFEGGPMSEIYNMDTGGRFKDTQDQKNFEQNITQMVTQGSTEYKAYNQVDLSILQKNIQGQNQARSTFAEKADLGQLTTAYNAAKAAGDDAATRQIGNAVGAIHAEGERIKQQMAQYNKGAEDAKKVKLDDVITAAKTTDDAALRKATQNMGGLTMSEAVALLKANKIDSDTTLAPARTRLSSRARRFGRLAKLPPPPPLSTTKNPTPITPVPPPPPTP